MDQYRDMLPKYRQLEGVDKQLKQIQAEYDQLKTKAASGTNGDAKYWCDKYHELLADTEN
jgi:conjugal transfer/entry exclusion protein